MQGFYLTEVTNKKKHRYWMASYPGELPEGKRKGRRRKLKMFSRKEVAESFLAAKKREYVLHKRTNLWEGEKHLDAIWALEILMDVAGGSLAKGAMLLKLCKSLKEKRGSGYEAALERRVELNPRIYLGCENEAKRRGVSLSGACEGMLAEWLELSAVRGLKELLELEELEVAELKRSNYRHERLREQLKKKATLK